MLRHRLTLSPCASGAKVKGARQGRVCTQLSICCPVARPTAHGGVTFTRTHCAGSTRHGVVLGGFRRAGEGSPATLRLCVQRVGGADAHTMARIDRPPLSTVRARPHRGAAAAAPGGLLRRGGVRACAILRGCATIATAPALLQASIGVCSRELSARERCVRRRRAASDAVAACAAAGAQTGARRTASAAAVRHVGAPLRALLGCVLAECVRVSPSPTLQPAAGSTPSCLPAPHRIPVSARYGGTLGFRSERRGDALGSGTTKRTCGRWGRPCSRCRPCGPRRIRCAITTIIVHSSAPHPIPSPTQERKRCALSSCAHTAAAAPPQRVHTVH